MKAKRSEHLVYDRGAGKKEQRCAKGRMSRAEEYAKEAKAPNRLMAYDMLELVNCNPDNWSLLDFTDQIISGTKITITWLPCSVEDSDEYKALKYES